MNEIKHETKYLTVSHSIRNISERVFVVVVGFTGSTTRLGFAHDASLHVRLTLTMYRFLAPVLSAQFTTAPVGTPRDILYLVPEALPPPIRDRNRDETRRQSSRSGRVRDGQKALKPSRAHPLHPSFSSVPTRAVDASADARCRVLIKNHSIRAESRTYLS